MPSFSYEASNQSGNIIKGRVDAADIQAARAEIRKNKLTPLKIKEVANISASEKALKGKKNELPVLSLNDKIDFTSTLQILTATGIPIIETLAFMEENAEKKKVHNVCSTLKKHIINGSTLAETMELNRKSFGRVYTGLVRAGEDSGELDVTLARMLDLLKKQASIKSRVVGALVYPTFIICVAVIVALIMLGFVFPAFESMFDILGGKLPAITRMCIDAGNFIREFWWIVILTIIAVIGGIVFIFKNPTTKGIVDRIVLKIFLLNNLMRFANYSNFLSVLQVAYDAGIPIVNSLYLANLTLENVVLRDTISAAAIRVQQGVSLSDALKDTKQMPNMILFMVATGEQSGRLGEMLLNCTSFIDKKLDDIIDLFTKLIEPFMLVIIGGMVFVFALALYMPLFGVYGEIGG